MVIGGFFLLGATLFMFGRVWNIVLLLVGASLVVPLGLLIIDYWLRYGGNEYRVASDRTAIVAYDRLFQTRLWRVESREAHSVRIERDRLHRWLDTATIVIECSDQELRLVHLHNPTPILDVVDWRASGGQR